MRQSDLRRLMHKGETWVQTLARIHHEAYLIEAFGYAASGVSPKQFVNLVKLGVVHAPEDHEAPQPANAFEVVLEASQAYARNPDKQLEMRSWSAKVWRDFLHNQLLEKTAPRDRPKTITDAVVDARTGVGENMGLPVGRHLHEAENVAHLVDHALTPPEDKHLVPPRKEPQHLDSARKWAYRQALERAGVFAKKLGDVTGGDFSVASSERWHFDKILHEVDVDLRRKNLRLIRQQVAEAISKDWTSQQLAHSLQGVTGDMARDWMRVARTELQNCWNEGVVLEVVSQYGTKARVARIPETTACHKCLALFLDDAGLPIVFDVHELIKNGNNMNKKPADWKPTISSVHPNCLCNVVGVPAGSVVDRQGIVKA